MKLFTVGKVPLTCERIAHRLEERRGEEVKVVDLTLKLQPLPRELASALDADYFGSVRRLLFSTTGDVTPDIRSVEFAAPKDERQRLTCYATPDTELPSIALDQVQVKRVRARTQKDVAGWALYLYVSFGPLGRAELEYVNAWYTEQRFITFDAAEPMLDYEQDDEDGASDADLKARRPAPMWDDDALPGPAASSVAPADPEAPSPATDAALREVGARQRLHSHATRGRKKAAPAVVETVVPAETIQ